MNTEDFKRVMDVLELNFQKGGLVGPFDKAFETSYFSTGYALNPIIDNSDTGVKITIKSPGMHKDNTKIEIKDLKMEIKVDDVSTCINLSNKLNLKKITASCEHGILVIDIPKKKVNVISVEVD